MRPRNRLLVCLYVAIAAAPSIAMLVHARDRAVWGALTKVEMPEPKLVRIVEERFQQHFVQWYEAHLGLKGYEIYADNTLLYRVFRESRYGANVQIGRDGVLFEREDLAFYNLPPDALLDQKRIDAAADQVMALQRRLAADHRALLPMLSPAKTTVYRDKIPGILTRDVGDPRPSDPLYTRWKAALDQRRVEYVDVRALMAASGQPRNVLWGENARHWSAYTGCLIMKDAVARYARLTGTPAIDYDCILTRRAMPMTHVDFDLFNLMNAWAPRRVREVSLVTHGPASNPVKPRVMVMGTSFCWALLYDAVASGRFQRQVMNYYNNQFVELPQDARSLVQLDSPVWRDATLGNDIYVVDSYEIYVIPNTEFLDQLGRALPPAAESIEHR